MIQWLGASVVSAQCGDSAEPPPVNFIWPATGPISNGWSLDCLTDRGHRGIDIQSEAGSPVSASADGVVIFCGFTPAEGGGSTISIEHAGGFRSTYLHLNDVRVSTGQTVEQGELVALSDGTPLHFGIKLPGGRDTYFNPLAWLPAPAIQTTVADAEPVAEPSPATLPAPAVAPPSAPLPAPALATPGELPVTSAPAAPTGSPATTYTSSTPEAGIASLSGEAFMVAGIREAFGSAAIPGSRFSVVPGLDSSVFILNASREDNVTAGGGHGAGRLLDWHGLAIAVVLVMIMITSRIMEDLTRTGGRKEAMPAPA